MFDNFLFCFQFNYFFWLFSVALQTGQLGPVLAQFGLPEEAIKAASEGDLQAFAQAMEKHYKKGHGESDEKKSSDSTMDTSWSINTELFYHFSFCLIFFIWI